MSPDSPIVCDQPDLLARLVDAVDRSIFWQDGQGRYLGCNRLFAEFVGFKSPEEIVGLLDEDLPPGHGAGEEIRELARRALETMETIRHADVRCDSGSEAMHHYRATLIPLPASDASAGGVLGVLEDVTERQETEKRLYEIQTALDDACDAICIIRPDGKASYINIAFMELFHCTVEMLNERGWESICGNPEIVSEITRTVQGGDSWAGEVELESSRVGRFPGEIRAAPIISDGAEIIGSLLFINNITERKKLESKLLHLRKMESIGSLAAGIAHEINTPTQYIGDNVRFLEQAFGQLKQAISALTAVYDEAAAGRTNPDRIDHARQVLEEVGPVDLCEEIPEAVADTLDGVHTVARIVSAMKEFSHPGVEGRCATDINRAIESTATVARNEWKYVAELILDLDPALPNVFCIVGEFNQVILNMIVNAAHAIAEKLGDATDRKGTISISTRRRDDSVEIRVQDTGTGIPEEIRSSIFDPFFTTKPVGRGTGQGLGIAHSVIVEKHGGTIDVESETGAGATFVIRLPLAGDREAHHRAEEESAHA